MSGTLSDPRTTYAFHELLIRQDGLITWQQARQFLNEKAVRHRIRSGRWTRMHRGLYLTHTGALTERQHWWAASLGAGNGRPALLAGVSALHLLGLHQPTSARPRPPRPHSPASPPETFEPVHVLVPDARPDRNPPPGVIVHRTRRLCTADSCPTVAPPCTTAARSVIDAAQWAFTDTEAIALIASAFQQRLVSEAQIRPVLARIPRLARRRLIETTVADAAGGSDSDYEIEFYRLCRRAGLPHPDRQRARTDRFGRRRYCDVYFDPWHLQVEIDGSQHMEVRGWYRDMRAANEAAIHGTRLLRFPGWAIRHRPAEVVADVRAALYAAGWRGEPPARGAA
ncbi:type IV toxin-antitoxin system AbiEi family antitoxin domain-containing protein [Actinoplanes palleronii]|uniref:DUF559 domain-containing protein n=1 Tax=Actinoplanes palleronii TaxID=113570 RepID=A0ABQ4BD34_9ACTN|nr:type IV toxin-antitoxin system AbiEi family antitoxin domain-containing protein [Actinoplanes palleronii]GIE68596.1 hypothetical protein Apa02nite_047040 [Actinoplanes palleronii]